MAQDVRVCVSIREGNSVYVRFHLSPRSHTLSTPTHSLQLPEARLWHVLQGDAESSILFTYFSTATREEKTVVGEECWNLLLFPSLRLRRMAA